MAAEPHSTAAGARVDRDRRTSANLERLISDLFEITDLGALRHFEHYVEPSRDGTRSLDMFRLVFANERQATLSYSGARQWCSGFFAGRSYPRGVAVSQVATIRHRPD